MAPFRQAKHAEKKAEPEPVDGAERSGPERRKARPAAGASARRRCRHAAADRWRRRSLEEKGTPRREWGGRGGRPLAQFRLPFDLAPRGPNKKVPKIACSPSHEKDTQKG